jgi:hypothetical protein
MENHCHCGGQRWVSGVQDWLLVAIPDRDCTVLAVKARYPNAEVRVDSEADLAYLAKYGVSDGQILFLVEGS